MTDGTIGSPDGFINRLSCCWCKSESEGAAELLILILSVPLLEGSSLVVTCERWQSLAGLGSLWL